jgi:predicted secreted protein
MTELPAEFSLAVGERCEVTLPGLGTAGYRWCESVGGDAAAVEVAWRRGRLPGDGPPVGASAPERLEIIAAAPGHVTIHLTQQRPWEPGRPHAEHTIEIEIHPGASRE